MNTEEKSQNMDKLKDEDRKEDYISGRNAVSEALRSRRPIDKVLVTKGNHTGSIKSLIAQFRERGVPIKEIDKRRLEVLVGTNHQGIAAVAACKEYATIDDLFHAAEIKGEPPFFIVCDQLEDPHNLGAIIRTADATGVHGVIIPKRRSVGLTSSVYKSSAGAVEYVPVARVTNISDTLRELKKRGVWIYGLDMDGEPWCSTDLLGPAAIVIGSEGKGIGRLVREQCDYILSLPMLGKVSSLNASVACGVILYEVARQRKGLTVYR
jgi:23S rRNA (guanosine2251-2'-O)-methyltransferase